MKRERRFDLLLGGRGSELSREFARYSEALQKKAPRLPRSWGEEGDGPYWNQLPRWLSAGCRARARPARFLDEILWGQTCLFYAVRIQDDVLDGAVSRSALIFAPLLFLSESERSFATVIDGRSKFWGRYRNALVRTVSGILEVARLQRDRLAAPEALLHAYGEVDAIFSVGAAAVCELIGKPGWIGAVDTFVSELGKVLLCLDDLDDVEEDLRDGRMNYPARVLLAGALSSEPDLALLAGDWDRRVDRAAITPLVTSLRQCLRRATKAIGPLALEPVFDLIDRTEAAVEQIHESFPPITKHPAAR